MAWIGRFAPWVALAVIVSIVPPGATTPTFASETVLHDLLLSLAHPARTGLEPCEEVSGIERLLSLPLHWSERSEDCISGALPKIPLTRWYVASLRRAPDKAADFARSPWFLPGRTLRESRKYWSRLGALERGRATANRESERLLDTRDRLVSLGRLVAEPARFYPHLEVRVHRYKFLLQLLAFPRSDLQIKEPKLFAVSRPGRDFQNPKVLCTKKVGIGSEEYPTPRGSYFLVRIFDKNPLWIPPLDRPWAWGHVPSRNVYGGHMMPFYKKRPAKGSSRWALPDQGLDKVATRVRMVDWGAYRIHGTNSPWSVGSNQSHGCVRMKNKPVKELADWIKLYAGMTERGTAANGEYVDLERPVRLTLY